MLRRWFNTVRLTDMLIVTFCWFFVTIGAYLYTLSPMTAWDMFVIGTIIFGPMVLLWGLYVFYAKTFIETGE